MEQEIRKRHQIATFEVGKAVPYLWGPDAVFSFIKHQRAVEHFFVVCGVSFIKEPVSFRSQFIEDEGFFPFLFPSDSFKLH